MTEAGWKYRSHDIVVGKDLLWLGSIPSVGEQDLYIGLEVAFTEYSYWERGTVAGIPSAAGSRTSG